MPDFDILGHYDYIVRYPDYKEVTIYYSDFAEVLDSILTFLVQNGKTLEINTKTYQLYRGRHPELNSGARPCPSARMPTTSHA